jgi:hypothetical protein
MPFGVICGVIYHVLVFLIKKNLATLVILPSPFQNVVQRNRSLVSNAD